MPRPAAAGRIFTVQCRNPLVGGLCERREDHPIYALPRFRPSPSFARCPQAKRLPSLEPRAGEAADPKARHVVRGRTRSTCRRPPVPGGACPLCSRRTRGLGPAAGTSSLGAHRGAAVEGTCAGDKDSKATAPTEAPPLAWGGVAEALQPRRTACPSAAALRGSPCVCSPWNVPEHGALLSGGDGHVLPASTLLH